MAHIKIQEMEYIAMYLLWLIRLVVLQIRILMILRYVHIPNLHEKCGIFYFGSLCLTSVIVIPLNTASSVIARYVLEVLITMHRHDCNHCIIVRNYMNICIGHIIMYGIR